MNEQIIDKLICPYCKISLLPNYGIEDELTCKLCHRKFFLFDNIFFTSDELLNQYKNCCFAALKSLLNYSIATRLSNNHFLALLKPNKKDIILDIGCGTGNFLSKINNLVKKTHGLDIDISSLKITRSLLNCFLLATDAQKTFPLQENTYDKAVSAMMIEHINQPEKFIFEVKRILKSEGVFILSSPNEESILNHTKFARLGHENKDSVEYHIRDGYSAKELCSLLNKNNFTVCEIRYFMFPFAEIMMVLTKIAYLLKTKKKAVKSQSEIFEVKKSFSFKILKTVFPIIYVVSLLEEIIFYKILKIKFLHKKLGHAIVIKAKLKK